MHLRATAAHVRLHARASTGGPSILVAHPSADLYGSDRMLLESVTGLGEAGWQVVVTVPGPGPLVDELRRRGCEVHCCPSPVVRKSALRPRGFLSFVLELVRSIVPCCRLIRRHATDGLYVNTLTIPGWLVLGRLLGARVTCHVHEAEGSAPVALQRLISAPLLLAQHVVLNSAFSRDVLTTAVPQLAGRSRVVYNGVPGPPSLRPARTTLTGPTRLLYVGRLSPRKGPQVVVAALALLREQGADVSLDLLGAVYPGYEWFEAELRAAVTTAGLGDRVRFLGFARDVWPHLLDSDIVVVPSVADEPFGNTAVEAVLAARPLVVSDTSGLREAAEGYASAQAVQPERPDELADAVQNVISSWPWFRRQAEADAAVAAERHSVQRFRRQLLEVLTPDLR